MLIHGGSSGIGLTAIQLAKQLGATVFTTAGSDDKAAFCRSLGADHAINYRTQDFVAEIARITGKRGVDVMLDMVGGDYIEKNLKCLALEGRLVMIAFLHGGRVEIDWRHIMMKRLTVTGSTLRASPAERKSAIARSLRENVWPLLESGEVKTVDPPRVPAGRGRRRARADGILAARSARSCWQVRERDDRSPRLAEASARQYVARPPDRSNTAPVENEHSSLASQQTSAAISSTVPKRPIGIFDSMKSMCCCDIWSKIAVRTAAGVTQLTRMPVFASSLPSDFVSPITAGLRRAVRRRVRIAFLARDRRDVDDAAVVVLQHHRARPRGCSRRGR